MILVHLETSECVPGLFSCFPFEAAVQVVTCQSGMIEFFQCVGTVTIDAAAQ